MQQLQLKGSESQGFIEIQDQPGYYRVDKALSEDDIIKKAKEIARNKLSPGQSIKSNEEAQSYLQQLLADKKNECFAVLFLNNQHEVLSFEEMFYGTVNASQVHHRVVVQRALELNASACILAHNHPSGSLEPSQSDKAITDQLVGALKLFDVRVLDHFIVCLDGTTSFAVRGLI